MLVISLIISSSPGLWSGGIGCSIGQPTWDEILQVQGNLDPSVLMKNISASIGIPIIKIRWSFPYYGHPDIMGIPTLATHGLSAKYSKWVISKLYKSCLLWVQSLIWSLKSDLSSVVKIVQMHCLLLCWCRIFCLLSRQFRYKSTFTQYPQPHDKTKICEYHFCFK